MSVPILLTKLFIPLARPELVSRSRLIEKLNCYLHRKLTLISAPAGFGKTTLVTDWLQSQRDDASSLLLVGWLSLDEGDNDAVRFLTYLITALNRIQSLENEIGVSALSMLQSPQPPPPETILIALINEITMVTDKIVLILDDYHLIDAPQVHESLNFLIENLPPPLHLVITTREDPPISISRLRARGQLIELRAADLRFTSSEAAEFLNQVMGLELSAENIALLEERTEGWIAGLQLAAVSMQGRNDTSSFIQAFTGSNRLVLDYLIEEVLDQQSAEIQGFLLKTAVLNRLTGPLCDAVTDQENGQETLEKLEQTNLFIIPLDDERRWYRYHHLFADLLHRRLRQTRPDELPKLHQRASNWFEQNEFGNLAIDHALRSKDFERASLLLDKHLGGNYEREHQSTLLRWLAEMPEELICTQPHLSMLHAWNQFNIGQLDVAIESLQIAEKLLNKSLSNLNSNKEQLPERNRKNLLGRSSTIRSFISSYSGDVQAVIRYANQALEYLPEQEKDWRSAALIALGDAYASEGQMRAAHKARADALQAAIASKDTYIQMIVHLNLADTLRQQGKLKQAIEICEWQLTKAIEKGISESAIAGWLFGIWSEVLAELNDLEQAAVMAQKGIKLAATGQDILYICFSNLSLIRVLFSAGDISGAEDVIKKMTQIDEESDLPLWASKQLSAWQVRIWLALGKLEDASQWALAKALDLDGDLTYLREIEYIAFARILFAQGKLDKATRLLNRLLEAANAGDRISKAIEILILSGLCAHKAGDTNQALSVLEQAFALAQPEGFIRTFVDEGPPLAKLLYEALSREINPDYVRQLLAAFPTPQQYPSDDKQAQTSEFNWVESLSERELELLQLLAEGLKNQEISARLYLSLNTVKVHNRNIFSKLGVKNRTQATTRARAMGLLKSD